MLFDEGKRFSLAFSKCRRVHTKALTGDTGQLFAGAGLYFLLKPLCVFASVAQNLYFRCSAVFPREYKTPNPVLLVIIYKK